MLLIHIDFRTRGRPRKYYCKICMTGEGLTKDQAITHYQSEHNISNFKFYPLRKFVRVMPVCEICKEEFSSYKELDVHLREHKSLYPCTFCDKSFPTMVYHTQHQFLHVCHSKCVICSEELTEKEHVTKHYGKHGEHYKPYKCEELNCCMRFPDADSLLAHGKTHRKKTPKLKSTEPVKFQCEKCAQFYATPWYLKTHLETVHKEIAYEDFNCPICTKVCKGEAALKRHKRRAHMTPHQVCHICGKSIKASQMNLHQLRHGDKTFACPFCDKMFAIKMALVEHERIHNGKKPYPCQHCGKGFSQAGSRRIHERLHTNERPYVCEFCGKAFTSGGMLNVHKKKCIPKLELVS